MTNPTPPARPRRRRRLWWVAGSALAVVLIVIGVVVVVNNQPSPAATRHAALDASLKLLGVSVDAAGGKWTYDDGKTPWVPGRGPGYGPTSCGTVSSSYSQYDVTLYGPIQPDPEKAAEKVAKFWKSQGYSVRLVFHGGPGAENAIEIAVDLPNRALITFTSSDIATGFEALSECFPTPDD